MSPLNDSHENISLERVFLERNPRRIADELAREIAERSSGDSFGRTPRRIARNLFVRSPRPFLSRACGPVGARNSTLRNII